MAEPNLIAQAFVSDGTFFLDTGWDLLGGAQIKGMTYDAMSGDGSGFADTLKCCE